MKTKKTKAQLSDRLAAVEMELRVAQRELQRHTEQHEVYTLANDIAFSLAAGLPWDPAKLEQYRSALLAYLQRKPA